MPSLLLLLSAAPPAGHPISGTISDIPLKHGDVLVVEAGPEFLSNFKNNRAFSLISEWARMALGVVVVYRLAER